MHPAVGLTDEQQKRTLAMSHAHDLADTTNGATSIFDVRPLVGGWPTVVSTRRSHRAVAPACRTDMVPASEPPSKGLAMRPLIIGILGILLSSMLVAGCGGGDASDPARPTPTPAAITITPVAMAGEGIGISQPITLVAGMAVVHYRSSGSIDTTTSFQAHLRPTVADGFSADIVNDRSGSKGDVMVLLPAAGAFVLDVRHASVPGR